MTLSRESGRSGAGTASPAATPPTRRLGVNGPPVTLASLGGAALGNLYRAVHGVHASATLETAWNAGIRGFDTAPRYGHGLSERRMGDFLRDKPREEFVLSTKVGRLLTPLRGRTMGDHGYVDVLPFEQEYDYSYDAVMRSHEDSLQRLGMDRIDVLYMHDIGRATHGAEDERLFPLAMEGGLKALQRLREEGVVTAIGLGVNEVEACLRALDHADLDVFLLAGRFTLLDHEGARPLLQACLERGARLAIGGVFNSGILATGAVPGATFDYAEAAPDILARVAAMEAVCRLHGVPLAVAAQHFPLHHPAVATLLVGARSPDELERSLEGLAAAVPEELWADLVEAGLMAEDLQPIGSNAI